MKSLTMKMFCEIKKKIGKFQPFFKFCLYLPLKNLFHHVQGNSVLLHDYIAYYVCGSNFGYLFFDNMRTGNNPKKNKYSLINGYFSSLDFYCVFYNASADVAQSAFLIRLMLMMERVESFERKGEQTRRTLLVGKGNKKIEVRNESKSVEETRQKDFEFDASG